MNPSKRFTLNEEDVKKWLKNVQIYAAVLALFYVTQVISTISSNGGTVELYDFVPTQATIGACVLYIFNVIADILKKFLQEK